MKSFCAGMLPCAAFSDWCRVQYSHTSDCPSGANAMRPPHLGHMNRCASASLSSREVRAPTGESRIAPVSSRLDRLPGASGLMISSVRRRPSRIARARACARVAQVVRQAVLDGAPSLLAARR